MVERARRKAHDLGELRRGPVIAVQRNYRHLLATTIETGMGNRVLRLVAIVILFAKLGEGRVPDELRGRLLAIRIVFRTRRHRAGLLTAEHVNDGCFLDLRTISLTAWLFGFQGHLQ